MANERNRMQTANIQHTHTHKLGIWTTNFIAMLSQESGHQAEQSLDIFMFDVAVIEKADDQVQKDTRKERQRERETDRSFELRIAGAIEKQETNSVQGQHKHNGLF